MLLPAMKYVVSKAGKKTFGLDRFFSGLQQQTIPGVSFFTFSLLNVQEEHSYPIKTVQIVKSTEEKANSKAKAEAKAKAKKNKTTGEKKKAGRPKGSKNKDKANVELNPELVRIKENLQNLLETIGTDIVLKYLVMDGHFGNYPSAFMVRSTKLHLVSKFRHDASLYSAYDGEYSGHGPKKKYGNKIDLNNLDAKYMKERLVEDNICTETYQGEFYNKAFTFPLNVVILVKTNLLTKAKASVILFTTDLELEYQKIIKFYRLRFQIEFNFRDAKQYWGLEDFMNIKKIAVTNAANISFFMVNFSQALLQPFREQNPDRSILDLKSYYRGYRYVSETIKMLPEKPDVILLADIFSRIAQLGAIHPVYM